MKTNTIAKVGTINPNYDEEIESYVGRKVNEQEPEGFTVKTGIKAGTSKDNIDPGFIRR